jgi:isochorismate synthase
LDSNRIETDLSGPALEGKLGGLFREASEKSRREGRSILASLTEPLAHHSDPIAPFAATAGACRDRLLWSQPDLEFSLTGVGAAYVIETRGNRRFSDTASAWSTLCSGALIDSGNSSCGPLLMGGFSFDSGQAPRPAWSGYPDGRMVLPRICVTTSGDRSWVTLNAVLRPDARYEQEIGEIAGLRGRLLEDGASAIDGCATRGKPTLSEARSSSGWRSEVAAAASAVQRGELSKVVLARAVNLHSAQSFDPALALRRLIAGYPTCVAFAVAHDDRCFLGATPERLLKVCQGALSTTCLAGSYARGASPQADRKLAEALLADPKEGREHALVLAAMMETLGASGVSLDVPDAPTVLKLPNVQHLCTPITGRLAPGRGILQIVEQLHPTASVGGEPRDLALRFIREREGMDRGWYAGPVGWVDHRGEGEFAVAIRAALLCGAQATLFAGCGIVAGSDPDREYAESCIKLTPMLTALGAD